MRNTKTLRIFMVTNDLTHREIARLLGISKAYVDDVLKFRSPSHHIRERMKRELGFPAELVDYIPTLNPRLKSHRASKPSGTQLNSSKTFGMTVNA